MQKSDNPGPGSYTNIDFVPQGPKASLQGRPKDRTIDSKIGPGYYEPVLNQTTPRIQNTKMGKSKRGNITSKEAGELPGPGRYESPSKFGEGPMYTIRPESPDPKPFAVPGPGEYE